YTSLSRLKRQAVKSQHGLVQTETLRAFTWWSRKQEYPGQELQKAWQDHLFNDFHDILTGTCIEPAEKDALGRYGRVAETAKALRLGAAICLNQGQSLNKGIPVTVLNTIPGMGAVPVEVECMISHRPKWTGFWHMNLFDAKNRAITCQEEQPEALLPFNGWRRKVVFMSELPSVGVTHYHLETKEGPAEQKTARPALDISFGKRSGLIERLGCSETRQLLSGPLLQPLVIDDSADSWGTGVHSYRNVSGEMRLIPESFRTVAEGPIRTIFESRLGFGNSRLTLQTFVYSQWPVLEFRLRLLWAEEQKRLKLSIPTKIKADSVVCEVPGGNIRRPGDGKEHVHGRWLVLDGRPQKMNAALGVINSGLHGFDFKDGEIRLSILRSAAYCHEKGFNLTSYPARKLMDLGLHEFRLLLTVGKPEDVFRRAAVLADWLNTPPFVCAHLPAGTADSLRSRIYPSQSISDLLTIKPENIRLLACKKSWEGDALIIRLQECCGLPARAEVTLHAPKRHLEMSFIPLEIKTLRINKNGQWDEVGLVDEA
ncbi:MAG: glycoside hydrolase family 38 C-terminal domain-containing protein, partial [Candidatus Aminicenantes bacterium]